MRGIVKGFVVGTLGLAVLFGSSGVSSAAQKLAGGNFCTQGPPAQLPPGKKCEQGYEATNLNQEGGGCVVLCCKDNSNGTTINCTGQVVDLRLDGLRNVLPGGGPPMNIKMK